MAKNISVTIKFWKQNGPKEKGHFDTHQLKNIPDDTSFLEALDIMNEELINEGKEPFVFDHDCREGICGMSQSMWKNLSQYYYIFFCMSPTKKYSIM
jgi:succinate dehydrogenase / fumarate reductase iron-sulfur subunit